MSTTKHKVITVAVEAIMAISLGFGIALCILLLLGFGINYMLMPFGATKTVPPQAQRLFLIALGLFGLSLVMFATRRILKNRPRHPIPTSPVPNIDLGKSPARDEKSIK